MIRHLLLLAIVAVVAATATPAAAEPEPTRSVSVSAGLGSLTAESDGTELTSPLQLRVDDGRHLGLELGRDTTCATDAWCAVLAFYRIGALAYLGTPSARGYAYGRLAYFLGGAQFLDGDSHSYNAELHYAAGAGFELVPGRVGLYVEAGVLGDFDGDYVGLQLAAGPVIRFGGGSRSARGTAALVARRHGENGHTPPSVVSESSGHPGPRAAK